MKRELNIENFIDFFNNEEQFISYDTKYYKGLIIRMLVYFYESYEEVKIEKEDPLLAGFCEITDGCELQEYYEIKKIQFNSFYPFILMKLFENNEIIFNIKEIGLLYKYILENHKKIRKDNNITQNGSVVCKIFLNGMYAISANNFSNFGVNKPNLISDYGRNIMDYIFNEYSSDIIYIDTDMIITKNISDNLLNYLNNLGLNFDVSDINFMIINKKRYLIEENGELEIKGFHTNSIRTRRNSTYETHKEIIEKFKYNLLYLSRIKKIKNIKNNKILYNSSF